MKKIIAAALLPFLLMLSACNTTPQVITRTQLEVVIPDKSLFYCPTEKLPDPATLTDAELSKFIVNLYRDNSVCRKNMAAIQKFLDEAKKRAEVSN
jgi:starvation-inducible outer membrane lipoprotein